MLLDSMLNEQPKIPGSKLIYYRTPALLGDNPDEARDHKLRNRNFSKRISSIEDQYFEKRVPKKTLSHYLGKGTTYVHVFEPDIVSLRSLNCKNLKTVIIWPRQHRIFSGAISVHDSQVLWNSLFHFSNLQSLKIIKSQNEDGLRSIRVISKLKRICLTIQNAVLIKKLDWQPRFNFLESLDLIISPRVDGCNFEENTFTVVLGNLAKFFSLPRLQHISFNSDIQFERVEFEEMLKVLPNLTSFKIQFDLMETPSFEEERIKHVLSQVDYVQFWAFSHTSDLHLFSEEFLGKTHHGLLKKSKKALLFRLRSEEMNISFIRFMKNLKTLTFTSCGLVFSMEIDPSFRCPDHVRSIIFKCLPEENSTEVIHYLTQFLNPVPQLDNFTFESSISDEEDLLQFIELLKLDCFKCLSALFITIEFKNIENYTMLSDQLWNQMSHFQNLKALGLRLNEANSFSLQALADSLRSLSKLEYLSLEKKQHWEYKPQSLLDFSIPFDALPNLSYFSMYLSSEYLSPKSRKKLKEAIKLKNLHVFEINGFLEDLDALKLLNKIKTMDRIQRVEINNHEYIKPRYEKDNYCISQYLSN